MAAILRDPASGREWRLARGETWLIGRSADAPVALTHASVAREHARVEFVEGGWFIADLGAPSGTRLNGMPVRREEMRTGDVIACGEVALAFTWDGAPPALDEIGDARSRLPQSFDGLLLLFRAPAPAVDSALIVARAGEALLRFCNRDAHRDALKAAFQDGLASPWPVVRAVSAHGIAALSAAGFVHAPDAGRAIGELLDDPADYVQSSAARALARVDPLAAAPRLHARALDALLHADPAAARDAAGELAEIDRGALCDSLRARAESLALDSREAKPRACAAAVLGEIAATGDARALRPLGVLLSDAVEEVRVNAVRALVRAGDSGRTALCRALVDASPRVFQEAAAGLAGTRDPALAQSLVAALRAVPRSDAERRARIRRALEDVTGERRGPDPDSWL